MARLSNWLVVASLTACTPAPATPAKSTAKVTPAKSTPVWLSKGPEIVGLVGDTAYYWDSAMEPKGGIVGVSVADGSVQSRREIGGSNVNGKPRYWLAGSAGYYAAWSERPQYIAEDPISKALSVQWTAPTGRWGTPVLIDAAAAGESMLVAWDFAPRQAVVAFSTKTGEELWSAPLDRQANGVEVGFNGTSVTVIWQQYSATAPTPTLTVAARVRALDPRTGETRWTQDYPESTGGIVVAGDTVVVASGADLLFVDGPTQRVRRVPTGLAPSIYPGFAVSGETVFVGVGDSVTAYEASKGTVQWRRDIQLGNPKLVLDGGQLYVTTQAGLTALDPATGAEAWSVNLDTDPHRLLASAEGVVGAAGRSVGFALPAHFVPETATLRGHVTLRCVDVTDVRVNIGAQSVQLSPDGGYEATVSLAGLVGVSVVVGADDLMVVEEQRTIPVTETVQLTGAGEYTVPTLVLDRCDDG